MSGYAVAQKELIDAIVKLEFLMKEMEKKMGQTS